MESRELELLRPLGEGGFGTVWLARLHGIDGFNRQVAVKLMKDSGASADIIARQRDEARLLGLLQHPHIVQVFDLTVHNGLPAVIMEFVEGADVATLLKQRGALPLGVAIPIAAAVAGALDAGWNACAPGSNRPLRVVHRDIKPANVLLTVHGAVKVLDFGVARADFDREGLTQSMAFGTPRFMAPEQFLLGEVGAGNDVYALAVTLWEMVMGRSWERPPLNEDRFFQRVAAQIAEAPEPIRPLLETMFAWAPSARPSADVVREQLEAVSVPGESLRSWARRHVATSMASHAQTLSANRPAVGTVSPAPPTHGGTSPPTAELLPDSGSSLLHSAPEPLATRPANRKKLPYGLLGVVAIVLVVGLLLGGVGLGAMLSRNTSGEATAEAVTPVPVASPTQAPSASEAPVPSDIEPPVVVEPAQVAAPPAAPTPRRAAAPRPLAPEVLTPEAPAVPTRRVMVECDGVGTRVSIDGRPIRQNPLRELNLTYGTHQVEVDVNGNTGGCSITVDPDPPDIRLHISKNARCSLK